MKVTTLLLSGKHQLDLVNYWVRYKDVSNTKVFSLFDINLTWSKHGVLAVFGILGFTLAYSIDND